MRTITITISAALLASCMTNQAIAQRSQPNWVPNFTGWIWGPATMVNQDSIVGGHGAPQMIGAAPPAFVCNANNGVATYPGMVTPLTGAPFGSWGSAGCSIDVGGAPPAPPKDFHVLVPAWQTNSNGSFPSKATYKGGRGNARPGMPAIPLYFCRAFHEGGTHPGKIGPGLSGCLIPWGQRNTSSRPTTSW
jgi:hypothetical protein